MPELPEVETSRRGIEPHVVGQEIVGVTIRERRLRWPVSADVENHLPGQTITSVDRRAKYLLINTTGGTAILHLGMSGHVSIVPHDTPAGIHDHVDIGLASGDALRLRDPRRFGSLHWSDDPNTHWLLKDLGPEPLGDEFAGEYLWRKSRGRRVAVKQFIMNANVVVGVGNIYASESLFLAGINPRRAAGRIALPRYEALAGSIREVLQRAIRAGGFRVPGLCRYRDSDWSWSVDDDTDNRGPGFAGTSIETGGSGSRGRHRNRVPCCLYRPSRCVGNQHRHLR